jgi:anti-sigma factor RsiW
MNCQTIRGLLSEYIDNELPEAERQIVATHLSSCADCTAVLGRLRRAVDAVADSARFELPDAASDRLAAAIEARWAVDREPEQKKPFVRESAPWWQRLTGPAYLSIAASMAVVTIAVLLWSPQIKEAGNNSALRATTDAITPEIQESSKKLATSPAHGGVVPETERDYGQQLEPETVRKTDAEIRQAINSELAQAARGETAYQDFPNSSKLLSERASEPFDKEGSAVDLKQAASIAVAESPQAHGGWQSTTIKIYNARSVTYKEQDAWSIVVEQPDRTGYFVGAIVRKKDGHVLYRKTRK